MARTCEAYVHWNGGICYVMEYPSQKRITYSKHFQRATRRARNLGFNVKIYYTRPDPANLPKDAVMSFGSYVLPRKIK